VLAIATSVLLALYFLLPQAVFSFIFSKFVPLRTFVRSKIEELNEILLLLILTFFLVYGLIWWVPIFTSFPFGFDDSSALRRHDYQVVVDNLARNESVKASGREFWAPFGRCARRQGRLLTWYYLFIILEAAGFGYLSKNYGKYQQNSPRYRWIVDTFLLPNISEWYPLLTDFTFRDKPTRIKADILCDDTLFQGTVAKHFLDKDGKLSGIILTDPRRFDRRTYLLAKDAGQKPKPDDYWREIPSAKLYFFADRISNLNLNYDANQADKATLLDYVDKILKKGMSPKRINITVEMNEPPGKTASGQSQ
jgi:hypothetical protein